MARAAGGAMQRVIVNQVTAVMVLLLLVGCAPVRQPMGEAVVQPFWHGDRMVMADGYRLRVLEWWPADRGTGQDEARAVPPIALVIAFHGMNDHAGAFAMAGEALASHGIVSIAYDQRGFGDTLNRGLWATSDTLVDDLATVIMLVQARYPALPVFLVGSSMGGAVVLVATAGRKPVVEGQQVHGVILNAPAVWARSTMPAHQRFALWLAERLTPGWALTGEGLDIWPSDNVEMLRALAADPLALRANRVDLMSGVVDLMDEAFATADSISVPTLILYGDQDQIIPDSALDRFWTQVPEDAPASLQRFPDGYHMLLRDLGRHAPITAMADWILSQIKPALDAKAPPDRAHPTTSQAR